jgi:hypothetical protein
MRPEVRALIEDYDTDAPYGNVERWTKVEQELATRPDIKQDLLNDLQRSLISARQTPGKVVSPMSMSALPLRSDLTSDEQKIITDELERVMDITHQNGVSIDGLFVCPAILLLSHYPSHEHEALVLRFLEREDRQVHTLLSAFQTLSAIGSQKSLEVMRQMKARFQAKNPKYWFLKEMNEHIGTLETRLKQEAATGRTPTVPASVQTAKPSAATTTALPLPENPARTTDWRVWLGLLAGLSLVIALSCHLFHNRKGK